ncbi:hypothetical protein AAMO2058_001634500 [Amorphochlora amoebiformis]
MQRAHVHAHPRERLARKCKKMTGTDDDDGLAQLRLMGFGPQQAAKALATSDGDLTLAVEILIREDNTSARTDSKRHHKHHSQYNVQHTRTLQKLVLKSKTLSASPSKASKPNIDRCDPPSPIPTLILENDDTSPHDHQKGDIQGERQGEKITMNHASNHYDLDIITQTFQKLSLDIHSKLSTPPKSTSKTTTKVAATGSSKSKVDPKDILSLEQYQDLVAQGLIRAYKGKKYASVKDRYAEGWAFNLATRRWFKHKAYKLSDPALSQQDMRQTRQDLTKRIMEVKDMIIAQFHAHSVKISHYSEAKQSSKAIEEHQAAQKILRMAQQERKDLQEAKKLLDEERKKLGEIEKEMLLKRKEELYCRLEMQNSNLLEEETLARQRNDLENEKKKIQKEKQILADREHKIYLAKQSANILKNQSQAAEAQSFKVLEGQRLALRQEKEELARREAKLVDDAKQNDLRAQKMAMEMKRIHHLAREQERRGQQEREKMQRSWKVLQKRQMEIDIVEQKLSERTGNRLLKDIPKMLIIIDTNWLVDFPTIIWDLSKVISNRNLIKKAAILVPKAVLSELDGLKLSSNRDTATKARHATQKILEAFKLTCSIRGQQENELFVDGGYHRVNTLVLYTVY